MISAALSWTPASEAELAAAAVALGAREVAGWSSEEQALSEPRLFFSARLLHEIRMALLKGEDPLGEAFCNLRKPQQRRELGATYTPKRIVEAMLNWAERRTTPARVIDPGVGSGRFLLEAGRRFPGAQLVGVEIDPLAALIARANLVVLGMADRAKILLTDYRGADLSEEKDGPSLFIGNPPYVRHHLIDPAWKQWLSAQAARRGYSASQLAGLHVHFFLATARHMCPGDFGAFITAAEWLDVNYGQLVRDLFVGELGGMSLVVIEPTALPFPDAATTAVISAFEKNGQRPAVRVKRVHRLEELSTLTGGRRVSNERLRAEARWSHLTRVTPALAGDFVELGELCRVHRGQVTGANHLWIAGSHSRDLPAQVLFPTVTRARELFQAGAALMETSALRRVIDLPADLAELDPADRGSVDRFLQLMKSAGADRSYIARNRRAWWSVGLREPAPILATYMARRPPAFVRNLADARHINIAHGLYPRCPLSEQALGALSLYLSKFTDQHLGRTYAGGLTKFEPREMERIPVPAPALLEKGLHDLAPTMGTRAAGS